MENEYMSLMSKEVKGYCAFRFSLSNNSLSTTSHPYCFELKLTWYVSSLLLHVYSQGLNSGWIRKNKTISNIFPLSDIAHFKQHRVYT